MASLQEALQLEDDGKAKKGRTPQYSDESNTDIYISEGVSGPLRNALRFLTQPELVLEFDAMIQESMVITQRILDGEEADEDYDGPVGFDAPLEGVEDWSEGTEELKDLTEEQICGLLGLVGNYIPGFNTIEDPDGLHDIWANQQWFHENADKCTELQLRWHQLIGIYKMLRNIFDKKPTLLMDEVGLGKTIQVVGVIALLSAFRGVYERTQKFPGDFGVCQSFSYFFFNTNSTPIANRKFQGEAGNIPDLPILLIVPVNLRMQWELELHKFLQKDGFDIFPYVGTLGSRMNFWKEGQAFSKSNQPLHRRIILATTSVSLTLMVWT